eukprot:1967938-Pyramimonas_sp.AAC.1
MGHPNPARAFPHYYRKGIEPFLAFHSSTSSAHCAIAYEPGGASADVGVTIYAGDITTCVAPGQATCDAKNPLTMAAASSRELSAHL